MTFDSYGLECFALDGEEWGPGERRGVSFWRGKRLSSVIDESHLFAAK